MGELAVFNSPNSPKKGVDLSFWMGAVGFIGVNGHIEWIITAAYAPLAQRG